MTEAIRWRRLTLVLMVALLANVVALAANAPATTTASQIATPPATPVPDDAEIPDTPVGNQLAWALSVFNDPDTLDEAEIPERFSPEFLAAVPSEELIAIIQQLAAVLAPFALDEFLLPPTDTEAVVLLTAATGDQLVISIVVDPEPPHRIVLLAIEPAPDADATPTPLASWQELDDQFAALAPDVGFLAAELINGDCQPVHALNSEQRLAIASTFKLYVLGELARQVETGEVNWDDELAIRDEYKSLPLGDMRNEPEGELFTLRHYAEQMISVSDNTATDHLLFHLGRENVEAFQAEMGHGDPDANVPILSTRELFALKLVYSPDQRDAYLAADTEEQRRILDEEIAALDMSLAAAPAAPIEIDTIEWFASANDLCQAMVTLHELSERPGLEPVAEILAINPGIPLDPETWPYAGFKGGDELGVLNLTWLLRRNDDRLFMLTISLSDPTQPIDETAVILLADSAVEFLSEMP